MFYKKRLYILLNVFSCAYHFQLVKKESKALLKFFHNPGLHIPGEIPPSLLERVEGLFRGIVAELFFRLAFNSFQVTCFSFCRKKSCFWRPYLI